MDLFDSSVALLAVVGILILLRSIARQPGKQAFSSLPSVPELDR